MKSLSWSDVTAIFGGRFDPPHLGHREAASGLFARPGVKAVRVLPSAAPPHKAAAASADHRLALAKLGFAGLDDVTIDPREIERARRAPESPTYSFDTLSELRRELPNLAFVIGTDQLAELHRWYRFPEILDLCHWIVLGRRPDGLDAATEVVSSWQASGLLFPGTDPRTFRIGRSERFLTLVETDARALSSTRIRETISRTGRPPEGALSDSVSAYLMQHALYGTSPQTG